MAGIRNSGMRPKVGKNIKSSSKKKRHKVNTEAQMAYHAKINLRRAKKMKK